MKILLTGSQGFLGKEVFAGLFPLYEVIGFSRYNLPLENCALVADAVQNIAPDIIINCAGKNHIVSKDHKNAKQDREQLFFSNVKAPLHLATIAQEMNISYIHISCSSVLGGSVDKTQKAPLIPVCEIGKSKAEAERILSSLKNLQYACFRCGILYNETGQNIVTKITKQLKKQKNCSFPKNVFFSLTHTKSVVEALQKFLQNSQYQKTPFHICEEEVFSHFSLAKKIAETENLFFDDSYSCEVKTSYNYSLIPSFYA
jgi:dTDP-4-dehydrorhamnose reductase